MGPCIVNIFQYISNKMHLYTVYLQLETALHVSGGTITHHQELKQLYLQHLVFVTPLMLPPAIAQFLCNVFFCQLAATYVCNTRSCNTVQMLLMMSEYIARNMQSSQGIINYPTQLHLVGNFHILYYDARKHEYQTRIQRILSNSCRADTLLHNCAVHS